MRRVPYQACLRLFNRNAAAIDVARGRGEVALAFGREKPDVPGEYWDMDIVAMALVDRLTRFFQNRRDAAEIVRSFWPQWTVALALAEDANENDAGLFYIGAHDFDGRAKVIRVGSFDEVTKTFLAMPVDKRPRVHFYVDVWEVVEAVRAAAKREDIELDERFFYSLDDPRFEATFIEEARKHSDRIKREKRAGKPRAAKATAPSPADILALMAEVRGMTLQ